MNRSRRLQPIARIAERRQQDAARVLKESRDELDQNEARLEDLQAYREEYRNRLHRTGNGGIGASRMKGYLAFLGKLDEAIHQLETLIAAGRQQCEAKRDEWIASRARFKALDEVISRYRRAERRTQLRREQRNTDERNLHQVRHRK